MAYRIPAFIPSPSNGTVHLGPIPLHMYGLLLAVGVVGARLYHVATDYQLFEGHWLRVFEIWRGGLSIWGVIIGGVIGVVVMARRHHLDTVGILDAMAPGVLAAQVIGRWGNYFNQELFGEPTRLPWALQIDPVHRPKGYERYKTFHPTFLYESLYCAVLLGVLLAVERRFRLRRGQSTTLYIAMYTFGRFWFENLRIDPAHLILGLRVNAWVSLLACVGATVTFVWLGRHGTVDPGRYPEPAPSDTVVAAPSTDTDG